MDFETNTFDLEDKLINSENILIIQDIDGVCIPLVKDPMTRELNKNYIFAVKKLKEEFFVLTCGEHEGLRGVNRIVENALQNKLLPKVNGLYLQGLAACGVEYQDNQGKVCFEGVTKKELEFLSKVPLMMRPKFRSIVKKFFPDISEEVIERHASKSICDTRFSPTINFNSLFELTKDDWLIKKQIQLSFQVMMNDIIYQAELGGLFDSFFLHISPNLGTKDGRELIKESSSIDIGSTDIQLLLKGALKDSGVLFLLNKFIGKKSGAMPFGEKFSFRDAPRSLEDKINLCKKYIKREDMPLIVGVGDTITSQKDPSENIFSRGGSDRSFLQLIQRLGKEYDIKNSIIFVDSSSGEVNRPSTKKTGLKGITDDDDELKFDLIFQDGPSQYINWFINYAQKKYPN